ncbi:MAG TPA: DNA/RNA nuclease SfsA [Rhodospirillales bacterium]|jgi:sugar fermentation stimulation protein A|nr:DNA/RNA nuclease SfsA [Rhodospirillales bacterium]HIL76921.1 DNA/RNA nuclease SfsA [Rhodospirillales bacterium]
MKFSDPLVRGKLIKRYKRFLVDIELESGKVVVAHCANPGSMMNLLLPDAEVWLSLASNPNRKLKYTWEMIRYEDTLIGLNTSLPNKIVEDAIQQDLVVEFTEYDSLKREVKYGENSRIDILLQSSNLPDCYLEVKSVTLKRPGNGNNLAEFPDSVTVRGTKHLHELSGQVANGNRAAMFYLVQREDCNRLSIAGDIDPNYANAFIAARKAGVEMLCYGCSISPEAIKIRRKLEIVI